MSRDINGSYSVFLILLLTSPSLLLTMSQSYRYSKEEPFSVISVDIRNQSTLQDSLEQYVKGELLEGADAYFCDKCNKKVGHKILCLLLVKFEMNAINYY